MSSWDQARNVWSGFFYKTMFALDIKCPAYLGNREADDVIIRRSAYKVKGFDDMKIAKKWLARQSKEPR